MGNINDSDSEIINQCLNCNELCDDIENCPIKVPQRAFKLKSHKIPARVRYLPRYKSNCMTKTLESLSALVSWMDKQPRKV